MFTPNSYQHPREEILQAMERIYRYRMTTTSGGNLSIREANGDVWITPARVDKGGLHRDDIVCVRPDGELLGARRPSSELPIHQEIRRRRPEVGGIVHAHPTALVAFSLVHQVPNTRLFHQARRVCGEVGFAPYELPGSMALGNRVADAFEQGYDCVILENHGVVTAGATFQDAFRRFETLEFTAKILIKAHLLGGEVRYLTDDQIALEQQRTANPEEFEPWYPSSHENELRRRLAEFVRRAYRQRLFISTQGSYSVRVDTSSFLITPYQADRGMVDVQDLVLVRDGKSEAGKSPSRAAVVHEAIYRRHPEVGAIVNAYPVNATAFSVTGATLDSRTIPESYVVMRRVGRASFGTQFGDGEDLAAQLSATQPAIILENDGVLVTGSDVLEAFDRLEVLESTAEAIINARAIGELQPLSDEVTKGLDQAFFGC
ncbi:MAG TPA: class II aldolase/adducin family protein [Candidatus Sulfopaludibacter sp.]|jgi:L-fuculose-phosphate aldolase|nr:class II aldolase/adducin family protein [Candidatus Sulfopaludibacter sp.]